MKNKYSFLLIIHFILFYLIFTISINAQEYWYFGTENTGVKFENNSPVVDNVHHPMSLEASAVLVDSTGENVLFYTDGKTVYTSNHTIMENGDSLLGCPSSVQTGIVPIPGGCNKYYVFSNSFGSGCDTVTIRNLFVSTIDMSENNGEGKINLETKNILLRNNVNEGLTLIPKLGTSDYWLVGVDKNLNTTHYVFLISNSGIELVNEYKFEEVVPVNSLHFNIKANLKDSGTEINVGGCYPKLGLYTLKFNRQNGTLFNFSLLDTTLLNVYDLAWSPDGNILYYSSVKFVTLKKWNNGMASTIYETPPADIIRGGGLKMGIDNRLYHIKNREDNHLSIIVDPNNIGINNIDSFNTVNPINSLVLPQVIKAPSIEDNVISGIINNYSSVIDICANTIQVTDPNFFSVGDEILLIQMQGATIVEDNNSDFGKIIYYNGAGNYGKNEILAIRNDSLLLKYKITNQYNFDGNVQVVSYPNLGNAKVCDLTCKPWNGTTGGILAFKAESLELVGNIDVSGQGFRGGNFTHTNPSYDACQNNNFVYSEIEIDSAGRKGEGLTKIDGLLNRGKGPYANGGGGGNNHNNGGGGGGNFGKGGQGGDWLGNSVCDTNELNQGLGGYDVDYLDGIKLFLGGGGGAGDSNNGDGSAGANGGGIVFLEAVSINSNGYYIKANGYSSIEHPNYPNNIDGGGGGGAGGSILLNVFNYLDTVNIEAKGGGGSSVQHTHGHGGGGGGGVLVLPETPNLVPNFVATGGANGIGIDGDTNDAQPGENGGIISNSSIPLSNNEYYLLQIDSFVVTHNCDNTSDLEIFPSGGEGNKSVFFNNTWNTQFLFENLQAGDYSLSIKDDCWILDTVINIQTFPILEVEGILTQDVRCDSLGFVEFNVIGGHEPIAYQLNDGELQNENIFFDLEESQYSWKITDASNCLKFGSFEISDLTEDLEIILPDLTTIETGDEFEFNPEINYNVLSIYEYNWSPKFGLTCYDCETPAYNDYLSITYHLNVIDEYGCFGSTNTTVVVNNPSIYVSNAFSPNGDGINDQLYPQGNLENTQIIKYFTVISRWGEQIFYRNNISLNNPSEGWDGKYKGKLVNDGVFVWVMEVEFANRETKVFLGDVTVTR